MTDNWMPARLTTTVNENTRTTVSREFLATSTMETEESNEGPTISNNYEGFSGSPMTDEDFINFARLNIETTTYGMKMTKLGDTNKSKLSEKAIQQLFKAIYEVDKESVIMNHMRNPETAKTAYEVTKMTLSELITFLDMTTEDAVWTKDKEVTMFSFWIKTMDYNTYTMSTSKQVLEWKEANGATLSPHNLFQTSSSMEAYIVGKEHTFTSRVQLRQRFTKIFSKHPKLKAIPNFRIDIQRRFLQANMARPRNETTGRGRGQRGNQPLRKVTTTMLVLVCGSDHAEIFQQVIAESIVNERTLDMGLLVIMPRSSKRRSLSQYRSMIEQHNKIIDNSTAFRVDNLDDTTLPKLERLLKNNLPHSVIDLEYRPSFVRTKAAYVQHNKHKSNQVQLQLLEMLKTLKNRDGTSPTISTDTQSYSSLTNTNGTVVQDNPWFKPNRFANWDAPDVATTSSPAQSSNVPISTVWPTIRQTERADNSDSNSELTEQTSNNSKSSRSRAKHLAQMAELSHQHHMEMKRKDAETETLRTDMTRRLQEMEKAMNLLKLQKEKAENLYAEGQAKIDRVLKETEEYKRKIDEDREIMEWVRMMKAAHAEEQERLLALDPSKRTLFTKDTPKTKHIEKKARSVDHSDDGDDTEDFQDTMQQLDAPSAATANSNADQTTTMEVEAILPNEDVADDNGGSPLRGSNT
jgi:hypothetical protein